MSIPSDVISPQPRPPEKSGNTCLILGLVFGGFGGFVLLCGGCCIGMMWFGLGEIERQTRTELANNPVIQEHIGTIETFEMDWMATIQAAEQQQDTYVFRVSGDKGSGNVKAYVPGSGGDSLTLESGQLTMDSGEVYELIEESILPGGIEFPSELEVPETPPMDSEATDALLEAANVVFARKVQSAVATNPVLMEHVGDISSFEYDIALSNAEPGMDVYVFHVSGSKASGQLRAECITLDEQTEGVSSAELVLDSGERVQLFPDTPLE